MTLDYFDLTKPNIEHHQLVTTYNFGSQELLDKSNNKGFLFDNQTNRTPLSLSMQDQAAYFTVGE